MNLKYEMRHNCLDSSYQNGKGKQVQDKDSQKLYIANISRFCKWAKETYSINNMNQLNKAGGAQKIIQAYENKLEAEGKSAATIHTYLSPICKGLNVHLQDIRKPKRTALDITRSRDESKNSQGKREAVNPQNKRLIEFQKITGLRRSEIAKLKVNSIVRDESGYLCLKVVGKGGKLQFQRILPENISAFQNMMRPVLDSIAGSTTPRDKIALFTKAELNNKIDLHGLRALHARTAYKSYLERCSTQEGKEKLQAELVARWNAFQNPADCITEVGGTYTSATAKGRRFIREFSQDSKYQLRGANKARCFAEGLPLEYDRTALLAVSVFHLSHWRNDVTVTNYML